MTKVTLMQIQCLHCREWFNSPIQFDIDETFSMAQFEGEGGFVGKEVDPQDTTSALIGNEVACPNCGKMTRCNKENIRSGDSEN